MAERALTEEAMLAGLHDIRLPSDAPGGLLADALAAGGLGLLLAMAVAGLVVFLTQLRPEETAETDSNARKSEPDGEDARRLWLLRHLKETHPERFADLAPDLYRRGGLPEIETLERLTKGDA